MRRRFILVILLLGWIVSRLSFVSGDTMVRGGYPVMVLDHGYHSGILLTRTTLEEFAGDTAQIWLRDFPDADWFEFGWGDRGFYFSAPTLADVSVSVGARALLWPSPSVMHVATGQGEVSQVFGRPEMVMFSIPAAKMQAIVQGLEAGMTQQPALGVGLYGDSLFYAGSGTYHMFFTCNSWVASVLRRGGIAASPLFAQSSKGLFWELSLRHN